MTKGRGNRIHIYLVAKSSYIVAKYRYCYLWSKKKVWWWPSFTLHIFCIVQKLSYTVTREEAVLWQARVQWVAKGIVVYSYIIARHSYI